MAVRMKGYLYKLPVTSKFKVITARRRKYCDKTPFQKSNYKCLSLLPFPASWLHDTVSVRSSFFLQRWSKRWFVLYDTSLDGVVRIDYYETESKHLSDSDRRTIPLRGYEDLQQISGDEIHTFVFEFTTQIGKFTYYMTHVDRSIKLY